MHKAIQEDSGNDYTALNTISSSSSSSPWQNYMFENYTSMFSNASSSYDSNHIWLSQIYSSYLNAAASAAAAAASVNGIHTILTSNNGHHQFASDNTNMRPFY